MKSLVTSLRDKIAGVDKKKLDEYKKWSDNLKSTINEKFSPLMVKFRSAKSSKIAEVVHEICSALKEMDDTSFLDCDYIDYVENSYVIQTKRTLLDLWSDILEVVSGAHLPNINSVFYSFALWIMKRPEFDLSLVKIDQKKNKFSCTPECLSLYVEYKELLEKTLAFVTENISSAITQSKTNPLAFTLDCDVIDSDTSTESSSRRKKGRKPKGAKYIDEDDDEDSDSNSDSTKKSKIFDNEDDEKEDKKKTKKRRSSESPDLEHKKKSSKKSKHKDVDSELQQERNIIIEEEIDGDVEIGYPAGAISPSNDKQKDPMPERHSISFMPPIFATFAAKFLSFAYFRLPYIQNKIISSVLKDLWFEDKDFVCGPDENPIARNEYVIMRRKGLAPNDDYPGLLKWDLYIKLLGETQPAESKGDPDSELWLDIFSDGMDFFLGFFSEWLNYVDRYIEEKVNWPGLPGFCEFASVFFAVYELKDFSQASITPFSQMPQSPIYEVPGLMKSPSIDCSQNLHMLEKRHALQCVSRKALTGCSCALLEVYEPYVFNGLMHVIFEKTRVFDINALSGCLTELETWFACIDNAGIKLDKGFDIHLLCRAIDAILSTDHLMIITRFLMTLYDHSKIFSGHARLELFGKMLITKHFTHLFLFWENNVRTAYIQILLFKVLSRKRSSVIAASKKKAEGQEPISSHDEINITLLDMMEAKLKEVRRIEGILEYREKEREKHKTKVDVHLKKTRSASFDLHSLKIKKGKKSFVDEEEDKEEIRRRKRNIPKALYIYIPRAMEDYRKKLSRYEAWEKAGGPQPKLILYKTVSGGKMQATPVRSQSAPLGKL